MIGTLIGNYKVERELGEGGMSHVYVGRDSGGNRASCPRAIPSC